MNREFTREVGRFAKGTVKNYPLATWKGIAHSAAADLDDFSRQIGEGGGSMRQPYVPKPNPEDLPGAVPPSAGSPSPSTRTAAGPAGEAAPATGAASPALVAGVAPNGKKRN